MGQLFARKGMAFECEHVDTASRLLFRCRLLIEVRDWCKLMPMCASLRNAYRSRKADMPVDAHEEGDGYRVPQSFSFLLRSEMPGQGQGLQLDESIPRRLRQEGNQRDVFCLVKLFMSDTTLCQPPLCVFPQTFLPSTEAFWNRVNHTNMVLTACLEENRAAELKTFADAVESHFPHLSRSVSYIRSILDADRPRSPYTKLKFVEAGPYYELGPAGGFQLQARAPPPKPHKLKVVFHHAQK